MKLEDALERAREIQEIEEILNQGGTFCSAFSILAKEEEEVEEWELGFYSPERDEITAVTVTEGGAELGVTDEPLRKEKHEIDPKKVEVGGEEALERAKEVLEDKYGTSYMKVFLSLKKEGDKPIWEPAFVGGGTSVVSVKIDAKSGEVIDSEQTSFVSKGKSYAG